MDGLQKLKSKLKKVHAISPKSKVFRQDDPLLAVLAWGVNYMMNELLYVGEQALILASDFKASSKISVANQHYNTHVLPAKYKFKEYCPLVFRHLRAAFKQDRDEYIISMCDGPLRFVNQHPKSGSITYASHDSKLLIKTMNKEAVMQFHHCFPSYHGHTVELEGNTLLPRYLGMYRVTIDQNNDVYMLVMNNIASATLPMSNLYDLKGSTVERNANVKELQKEQPLLKDNDFLSAKRQIHLGPDRDAFLDTLRQDVAWLEGQRLMDYRLLVGMHEYEGEEAPAIDIETDVYARPSAGDDRVLYFIGIVDVLTRYNLKKKAAHQAKTAKHGTKAEISTVNPEQYAKRFLDFVQAVTT